MRGNPYDWINQTREHKVFGTRHYPLIAGLAGKSNGYPAFAMQVQSLPGLQRNQYIREWRQWFGRHGKSWEKMGCLKENRLGQYTDRYRWTEWKPGLGAFGSFDTSVGMGWTAMGNPGANFIPKTNVIPIPGYPGWVRQIGMLKYDKVGDAWPWCLVYAKTDGSQYVWYYKYSASQPPFPGVPQPTGGGDDIGTAIPSSTKAAVTALQKALNLADARDSHNRKLNEDGNIGPDTCYAAYQFKSEMGLGTGAGLPAEFWLYLGLPESYVKYKNICSAYSSGTEPKKTTKQPGPLPEEETPDPTVKAGDAPLSISKAGLGGKKMLLLGGALLFGGLVVLGRKKKKRGKRSKKRRK